MRVENGFNILRDKFAAETLNVVEKPKVVENVATTPEISPIEIKPDINKKARKVDYKMAKQIVADNVISFVTPKLGEKL